MREVINPELPASDDRRICAIDAYVQGLAHEFLPADTYGRDRLNGMRDAMFAFFIDEEHKLPSELNPDWSTDRQRIWRNLRDAEAVVYLTGLLIRDEF